MRPALVPWPARFERFEELLHGPPYAVDPAAVRKLPSQTLRNEAIFVLEKLFQCPECQLRVVAWVARGVSDPVADQVVAYFAMKSPPDQGQLRFRGVPEGVADGRTQEHPLDTVEVETGAFGSKG